MDRDFTIPLTTTENEKDVGVTFSNDLKFNKHISNIINKSNQLIGLIKRSFLHLDKTIIINLYKT